MLKKKYDLTSELVDVENQIAIDENPLEKNKSSSAIAKTILITMSIDEELRAEYKSWCARHRMKMNEAFTKSFKLLKDKYGP